MRGPHARVAQLFATLALALLSFTACVDHDLPTASVATTTDSRQVATGILHSGIGFPCTVSSRTAVGSLPWRYGRGMVHFAPDEVARNGATIRYHFRGYVDGATLVSTANCLIPRTEAAIRRMNSGFEVRQDLPSLRGNRVAKGPRMYCSGDTCSLEGMYVSACTWGGAWPYCYPKPTSLAEMQCGALNPDCGNGSGTGEWTWDGGGGQSPEPDPAAGDTDLNEGSCPANDPSCNQPLNDADKQSLIRAIGEINRDADDVCAQLADRLQQLIESKSVYRGAYDSGHTGGAYDGKIHVDPKFWDNAAAEGGGWDAVLASALLHETAHLLFPDHVGETRSPYHTYPYDHMFNPDAGVPQCA
jgi:hypothetical protein